MTIRILPDSVDETVQAKLEPNESVRGWSNVPPDSIVVRLIGEKLKKICKPRGRGAGAGRSLHFKLEGNEWVFVGEGGWIS